MDGSKETTIGEKGGNNQMNQKCKDCVFKLLLQRDEEIKEIREKIKELALQLHYHFGQLEVEYSLRKKLLEGIFKFE